MDFTSILKFIEENWGVAPLASRDAAANSLSSAFDFTQPPRQAAFLTLSRQNTTGIKANAASVIYIAYGIVVGLFILMVAIVFIFRRKTPEKAQSEGSE